MTADPTPNPLRKLTAALERLERTAAEELERSRELAAALAAANQEADHTHEALLGRLEQWVAQGRPLGERVAQAGEQAAAQLTGLQQQAESSAQGLAAEAASAQATLTAMGAALAAGFAAQRDEWARQEEIDAQAAAVRRAALAEETRLLAQEQGLLAEAQASLASAVASARAALQDMARLQAAQATAEAAALNQQALAAYEAGRRQAALVLLEQAVALTPDDTAMTLNLARLYSEAGQFARAEALCADAAALLPENSPALAYTRGLLALRRGDPALAVELFTQAAGAADSIPCRLRLAEAHYRAGHPQQAVAEWRRVLSLDPDEPEARGWLEKID